MQTGDTIIQDEQSAAGYNEQAQNTAWFAPEVVFGLAYEFVKTGDTILDLGIGSGLASIPFHKAGLHVYGLDGSSEILKICASKVFAAGLKLHDLRDLPLPYPGNFCNHVIAVGVLNSFKDLSALFKEVARIIQSQGIFAFTVENQQPDQADSYAINRVDVNEKARVETAVTLYRHSDAYITQTLYQSNFTLIKGLQFLAFKYPAEHRDIFFKAYVARKTG